MSGAGAGDPGTTGLGAADLDAALAAAARAFEDDHDPSTVCQRLHAAGFTALVAGSGAGRPDAARIARARDALAYHSPMADSVLAVLGLGCFPVAGAGTPEQRAQFLAPVAAGRAACGFALTEPEAGSDIAAMATSARPSGDGDGVVLTGKKTFISNAPIATWFTVFAKSEAGPTAYVALATDPGVRVVDDVPMSVDHPIGSVVFDDARLPPGRRLGEPGHGVRLALATLDVFRVTVAAAAMGMARRALAEAILRVKTRRQFGKALAEFQLTQARLADMATNIAASRGLIDAATQAIAAGAPDAKHKVAMAKLFATEAAQKVVDDAVQLHGGLGVTRGVKVEALYREIRALRIYEGTSEIQKLIIARDLLK
jgi:acyl-CoA dehydrogenase